MGAGADARASAWASPPVMPPSDACRATTAVERRARSTGDGAPARRARLLLPTGTGRAGRWGLLPRGAGSATGAGPRHMEARIGAAEGTLCREMHAAEQKTALRTTPPLRQVSVLITDACVHTLSLSGASPRPAHAPRVLVGHYN